MQNNEKGTEEAVEKDKPKVPVKTSNLFSILGMITGGLALTVSIISAYSSYRYHVDSTEVQLISSTYNTFYDLNKKQADNSELSHMFVSPEDYKQTAKLVTQSVGILTPEKRAAYLLKEKGISFYIFTAFEQTFYQYQAAVNFGDKKRSEFLKAVLDYFTGRLLRNPRLLYYWDKNGGNVSQYYETETKKYYEDNVPNNPKNNYKEDIYGPYLVTSTKDSTIH